MDASIATEPTRTSGNGDAATQNVGRIEEIQGVVIEAVFTDRLPEINHAITIARTAANREEEAPGISAGWELGAAFSPGGGLVLATVGSGVSQTMLRWARSRLSDRAAFPSVASSLSVIG